MTTRLSGQPEGRSTAPPAPPPTDNRVLASLPEVEFRALEPKLEYVRLQLGKALYEPGDPARYVYFPTQGIVSLLYVNASGASTEMTVVGPEGMVGLAVFLGSRRVTDWAVVQVAGNAYRLPARDARASFADGTRFQALALQSVQEVLLQVSQTAVCNLHHSVEQRLCRWLLMCLDRLEGNEIGMTHELIASMLGVRRQGITEAAARLQKSHIISSSRGNITVVDRHALEECACECYGIVRRQTDTLF